MPTEQQQPQAGAQTLERVVSLGGERCLRVTFSSEDLNSLRGGSPKLGEFVIWLLLGITLAGELSTFATRPARSLAAFFTSPPPTPRTAKKAAWRSRVLQDLQEETHFSSTELEVLLHHFQVCRGRVGLKTPCVSLHAM